MSYTQNSRAVPIVNEPHQILRKCGKQVNTDAGLGFERL